MKESGRSCANAGNTRSGAPGEMAFRSRRMVWLLRKNASLSVHRPGTERNQSRVPQPARPNHVFTVYPTSCITPP